MTAVAAADRLADGYPHGTPAGYRDGCRSQGGCLNRGTTLMTCVEAKQRYAHDLHYRRAYDAGDIILDREKPLDEEAESKRTALARRTVPNLRARDGQGWAHQSDDQLTVDRTPRPTHKPAAAPTTSPEEAPPTATSGEVPHDPIATTTVTFPDYVTNASVAPVTNLALVDALAAAAASSDARRDEVPEPAPKPPRKNAWKHGTAYGYERRGCRCDQCTTAYLERHRKRHAAERAKPKVDEELTAAQATIATQAAEISRLTAELATARSNLAELAAMKPRTVGQTLQAGVVGFDLEGEALTISLRGLLAGDDITRLRRYLALSTLGATA